ncbi:hypothetical protein S58_20510 [Bradyrhizobium oligotrophicum S58]|uniref:Uncharacterized protein n=1 Tax=Bradyrhizobium oligotrophicum S58 TaxID=1245469 RepID=M4Z3V8_9BRAD|nr:hypothetical protein S58_20510 [Bradyrhizobium oligotrophicum S58]
MSGLLAFYRSEAPRRLPKLRRRPGESRDPYRVMWVGGEDLKSSSVAKRTPVIMDPRYDHAHAAQ